MLAEIHDKVKGIFATIVLLMIAVPFVLWGVNSYFEAGPSLSVAKVDGEPIPSAPTARRSSSSAVGSTRKRRKAPSSSG